jgi:hypothetical protein
MKKLILLTLCLFTLHTLKAQSNIEVSGIVKDSIDNTIIGASVKLATAKDTISATTNADGIFIFNNVKSSQFSITISGLGYQTIKKRFLFDPTATRLVLDPVVLRNDTKMLKEVVVNGIPDVTVKEDTLEYRSDAYKLRENATTEDLLKKLPGVEVDKDGNVTAQGKAITKIRVNGKDFFGGDVKTATQQLPADLIEKVQVVDDYGDQANITGVKDGDPVKILNLVIRKDKNKGLIVRGTVGGGSIERYQGSVFAASFNNSQQFSALANLNNTNANIFNLVQNGGGRGRGGVGGDNNSGLTDVKSFGFNYRDEWSKKVTAYGSYSFTYNNNNALNYSSQVFSDSGNGAISNINDANSNALSNNHRFNFNIEYKIDSLNYLKVIPNFSYGTNNGGSNTNFNITSGQRKNIGNELGTNNYTNPNYGLEFLYNHRFGAKPRNLSLNGEVNSQSNNNNKDVTNSSINYTSSGQTDLYQRQIINNDNTTDNYRMKVSYTEPLTKTNFLEFNYTYGLANINNNRYVSKSNSPNGNPNVDPVLSNNYDYKFITNRFGLNYRVNQVKYNYTLGMAIQPSALEGSSVNNPALKRTALNIFPTVRYSYKFAKTRELNLSVDGRSNQPNYSQLQPVLDNSNLQFPVIGNPALDAEFTTRFNARYNNFDFASGNVFFSNLSFSTTNNKIVSNQISNPAGNQGVIRTTTYGNAGGYYTINGFYAFSKPFKEKAYVLSFRGFANYNNNISLINGEKNIGKNTVLNQRLNFQINPKTWLEVTPSVSYSWNNTKYSLNSLNNNTVNTWTLGYEHKIYFTKTILWGASLDKNFNSGFNSTSANPLIINTYLEKQFFKGNTGALRFQAFDLLNQNTNISRTVTENYTLDNQSNRLARYFMLTFTMKFQKFAGKSTTAPDFGGGERRYRRED